MSTPQPLQVWPEQATAAINALACAGGLAVIGVRTPHSEDRAIARQALRTAVHALLAQFWQCPAQQIEWSNPSGRRVTVRSGPHTMQLSFSHAPGLSVAALHCHRSVGVDILRIDSVLEGGVPVRFAQVKEEPAQRAGDTEQNARAPRRIANGTALGGSLLSDWEQLAHDYLGPAAHLQLKNCHAPTRAQRFAQHWSELEAGLKCLGLGLQEWSPQVQQALDGCHRVPLCLPQGLATEFIGSVALRPLAHAARA